MSKKEVKKPVETQPLKLEQAVDVVLRTEAGRILWAHLAASCGFYVSSIAQTTTGEVAPIKTECLAAQRALYLGWRKLASKELLRPAEDLADAAVVLVKSAAEERKK